MDQKKIIGIDLGGTQIKFGIIDTNGKVQSKWNLPTNISDNGQHILPDIIESINSNIKKRSLSANDFIAIGMGSPGTVNRKEGTVVGAYNLNWMTQQDLKNPIEEATEISFYIDNDANLAALGEQWKGAGNKEENVLFVTLGTGVGAGLISEGHLLHGATDAAGEIGHLTVEPNGYMCTCGKKGCLEQYASATGIVRLANDLADKYTGSSSLKSEIEEGHKPNAKQIFDLAKENDPFALTVVDRFSYYLALGLSNAANLLNPSTIVLGGGLSQAGDFLVNKVSKKMDEFLFKTIREVTKLTTAELGNDAGIIGAASLVLNEFK